MTELALDLVDAPVAELRENPENPRTITDPRFDALKRSLDNDPAMMRARPLIALPDGTVIAGNMRLRAARELGWETVPTVYADLDHERARLWLLRDNNPYGDWAEAELGRMLSELAAGGADMVLAGFDDGELDRLLADLEEGNPVDDRDYDALALAQATVGPPRHTVERGQEWSIDGRHTLVVAGVLDGHPTWGPLLAEHDLFVPYPTPMLPLTKAAESKRLLMVQPNEYLAGHLLDRYEDHHGDQARLERVG